MTAIEELWRLPDRQITKMDGSRGFMRQLAIRQDNWINWYRVLPDHGGHIAKIPEGSVPLILNGEWVIEKESNNAMNKQATLPEDLQKPTIGRMTFGESAYTTPWAMWVDMERKCWLHPNYPAESAPHGTVQMRIILRANGFHVWPPDDYRWEPSPGPSYIGGENLQYIPVTELHK